MVQATRIAVLLTSVLAASLAIWCPSVVNLWYTIGTIGVSGLLIPMLVALFFPYYCSENAAFLGMLAGGITALIWLMLGQLQDGYYVYPLSLEPLYPGLMAALIVYGSVRIGGWR
jgi:Na+(H+)/acetate symporter ActP